MKITIGEYRVDNIKYFKDHEDLDAFKCDIFHYDEKIGTFSEHYYHGPDEINFYNDFEEQLNKIRKTANEFFKKYSKEEELYNNENFFIRFLKSLKEGCDLAEDGEDLVISTSYPYDYEFYKTLNNGNRYFTGDKDIKLAFQVKPINTNISITKSEKNKEGTYGLD